MPGTIQSALHLVLIESLQPNEIDIITLLYNGRNRDAEQ